MKGITALLLALASAATLAQPSLLPGRQIVEQGFVQDLPQTESRPPKPLTKKEWLSLIFDQLPQELFLKTYADIDAAYENNWLVDIPDDVASTNIKLRMSGPYRIGQVERNPKLRKKLFRLAKPAAGLLYLLADRLREEEVTLPSTSLVRPWVEGQLRLMKINVNADTRKQKVPPTHVYGLAFDIAYGELDAKTFKALLGYVKNLEAQGKAAYFFENGRQAALHIIALPAGWSEFEAEYARLTDKAAQLAANNGSK